MGEQICPWCGETRKVCEKGDDCPPWDDDPEDSCEGNEADLATDCVTG